MLTIKICSVSCTSDRSFHEGVCMFFFFCMAWWSAGKHNNSVYTKSRQTANMHL